MFQEANVTTRSALRFAVRAVAYADAVAQQDTDGARDMALVWYGRALESLGEALKAGTEVDDHVLMTIVVLDLFEVSFFCKHRGGLVLKKDSHCIWAMMLREDLMPKG
jgi:hypothetical protein